MKPTHTLAILALSALTGCAAFAPPSADKLAALPVVSYPDAPSHGDYVYRLPAGQPIAVRIQADGSALAAPVEQEVSAALVRDLYLYQNWASEDGKTWQAAEKLVGVNLRITLPSYEAPGPGSIHLTVDRKAGQ